MIRRKNNGEIAPPPLERGLETIPDELLALDALEELEDVDELDEAEELDEDDPSGVQLIPLPTSQPRIAKLLEVPADVENFIKKFPSPSNL